MQFVATELHADESTSNEITENNLAVQNAVFILLTVSVSVKSFELNKLLSKEMKLLYHIKTLDHFELNGVKN